MNEETPLPPSLLSILHALNSAEDEDVAFLTAGTFNLYMEAQRRLNTKVLMQPSDVKNVLGILEVLLRKGDPDQPYEQQGRSRELTEEEKETVLSAVEAKVTSMRRA